MGSRFVVAFLAALFVSLATLAGAGYGVTLLAVPPPRDMFRTGFFEFEVAPGWACDLDGTEYVCQAGGAKQKGAIAVMATKERKKGMDSLEEYEAHLSKPQPLNGNSEATAMSVIKKPPARIKLGDSTWVESLHCGSELKNFCTYYLGTVTSHVGILITMSYREGEEGTYMRDLSDMMRTVRMYQR